MSNPPPSVISVVICTYNRCESLRRTLDSLCRMSPLPGFPWEVIVVDNNSSDATQEIVQSFARTSGLSVRYVFEGRPGLSHARNRGVEEAKGEITAFIDDDVSVSPDWLLEVKRAFDEYDAVCVAGRVLLGNSLQMPSWWHKAYDAPLGKFDRGDSVVVPYKSDFTMIGIGANMSFKRSAFEKYGYFRTDMGRKPNQLMGGEETDLVRRLRENRELVIYCPQALVYHYPSTERLSKRYLRRNFYRQGEYNYLRELDSLEEVPRICGVPRWKYRWALETVWKIILSEAVGDRKEAFYRELQFISFIGYFRAAQKMKQPFGQLV